jgi:hypothetical protein
MWSLNHHAIHFCHHSTAFLWKKKIATFKSLQHLFFLGQNPIKFLTNSESIKLDKITKSFTKTFLCFSQKTTHRNLNFQPQI